MPEHVVNIAAYKFATLTGLAKRRDRLRRYCAKAKLRGTILLAEEGINLFVAGEAERVERLLARLEADPEIGALEVKRSFTAYQPFNRMLVKVKREIIALGVEHATPANFGGQKMTPAELKQWLDAGRDFTLLDTRNEYEVRLGTFERAVAPQIDCFRDFPSAVESFPSEWRKKPLVMFCTGGIRCEKAGPLMERLGFEDVRQLDGGILRYFQEVGQQHYRGDCFVFDQRVAVDAALQETGAAQCYACQAILTEEEQLSPYYVKGESCPHCVQTPAQQHAATLDQRHADLRRISTPLPGSVPYDNLRPVYVPSRCQGMNLVEFLTTVAPAGSPAWWRAEVDAGRLRLGLEVVDATRRVTVGERYDHLQADLIEPDVNASVCVLHEDSAIVVVHKPAPLPMHPCGRFNKNTLSYLLAQVYHPERLRNAHRLDSNTSGVVVFTRTRRMARRLQTRFAERHVQKNYVARVHGHPREDTFLSVEPIARENARAGIKLLDPDGLPSETRFEVLRRLPDGTSLLAARPMTGRTNQIRAHLWGLGLPIAGDPTYLQGGAISGRQALDADARPMCLHARSVAFDHPASGERVCYTAPLPSWAEEAE